MIGENMKMFELIVITGFVSGVLSGLAVAGAPTSSLYPAEQSGNVLYGNRGGFAHSIVLIANATDQPMFGCPGYSPSHFIFQYERLNW